MYIFRYTHIAIAVLVVGMGACGSPGESPDSARVEETARADESLSTSTMLRRRTAGPKVGKLLIQAQQAYQQGDYRRALSLSDSARKLAPNLADGYFLRGRIFTELDQLGRADSAYRQVIRIDPQYRGAHFNLGSVAFRKGEYRRAQRLYEQERALYPSARVWLHSGRIYRELERPDSARMAFEKAVSLDSTFARAYHKLSQLAQERGSLEQALTHARRAVEHSSDEASYQYQVGSLLRQSGQHTEAIEWLTKVTEQYPWHRGAHYQLGQALLRLGRQEEASRFLSTADSLQRQQSEIERLEAIAKEQPERPQPWVNLANELRQMGRFDRAIEACKVAVYLRPKDLALQNNMANLFMENGEVKKAASQYRKILKQAPNIADLWVNLGVAYARMDRIADARQAWKQALSIDVGHRRAKTYLARTSVNP